MASATVDSNDAAADEDIVLPLRLDSIPTIDLDLLSQSELYTLSLCSSSTFDPRSSDDLVIPKIDRSVFNESAGSRKQTYSRLRLAPATSPGSPSALRRRGPVIRSSNFNTPVPYNDSDPEVAESRQIVDILKKLFGVEDKSNSKDDYAEVGNQLIPVQVDYFDTVPQLSNADLSGQKRKRGRPAKHENVVCLMVGNNIESFFKNSNVLETAKMNDIASHENTVDRDGVFVNYAAGLVQNKVESECENSGARMVMMNEIVVRGNVDDRDRELVNRDGNVVDLVGLGLMEDPYAVELGRRTEGMVREEELLMVMNGLNGEWVSRRKKRRIIDACEFGNVLPKGWRLMLACRKKDNRIWLYCRRYLSPNGRQFVSCKEISNYLLSLPGTQDANQMTCTQQSVRGNNVNVEASDNFETAVLVSANETGEENDVSRFLSHAFASMSGDYGVQASMEPQDQPVVQVASSLNCDTCNLLFNCQDELLHHQLSSHRRKRSKVSVTDGVIIREGKYECQFCHKTFDERKRYNGHMGSHVRGQVKVSDESPVGDVKEAGGSVSLEHSSYRDSMVQTLTATESSVASKVTVEVAGNQLNSSLPPSSDDKYGVDGEAYGDKFKFEDSMDVDALETNEGLRYEATLSSVSNEAAKGSVDSYNEQERISESCLPLPLDEQTNSLRSNEVADESKISFNEKISESCLPLPLDEHANSLRSNEVSDGSKTSFNEKRISESCSPLPFYQKTDSFVSNEAANESEKCSNEQERTSKGCSPLHLDKQTRSFNEANGSEQYCNEQERAEGRSPLPLDKQMNSFDDMINGLFESNRETISGSAMPGSNENLETCDIDWDSTDFSHTMDELGFDENKTVDNDPVLGFCDKNGVVDNNSSAGGKLYSGFKDISCGNVNFGKDKSTSINKGSEQTTGHESSTLASSCGKEIDNEKDVYGLFTDATLVVDDHDNMHIYGTKEHVLSADFDRNAVNKDSRANITEKHTHEIPNGDFNGQKHLGNSKSLFTSLSSFEEGFGMDKRTDNVSSRVMQHHVNDPQIKSNADLGFPFPTSNNVPIRHAASKDNDETKFGFRSLFPSENRKIFSSDDNTGNLQSCAVGESKDRLLARSYGMESPHEERTTNKIFPTQFNDHGSIAAKNSSNNGLCLAFDSQASSSVNQMEQYGAKGFGIHPGMDQTYGFPRNLNNFGISAAGNPMERGFGIGLHDSSLHNSSFSDKSAKFGNSFNLGYPGRTWDGGRLNETVNSSNKFMVDFVNSTPQPAADVMSRSIWQTGEGNFLQHDVNPAPALVQPSNNFHTFDIISDKGHGGLFEVDQKYNNSGSYEGLTLGRTEPTEYTFMSTQNSNSLPGGSKGFAPYSVQTQTGFSSYWPGKDALMANMTVPNRVPTICVWCRNEFYEDRMPSAAQSGAVGSMCATCSSRFSQQYTPQGFHSNSSCQ